MGDSGVYTQRSIPLKQDCPLTELKANERHAKMGFVAAGIFPPPVEYMSDIKLPADIPAKGTTPPAPTRCTLFVNDG